MEEIEIDGVRTYYEEHGSGPPLVLVHGLGTTGTAIWKNQIADLARDFRVVVYDLRGSGRSSVPPGPYSLRRLVDDLDGLIARVELASVALVGHSMGGAIVLEYAALHPDRVVAVVAAGAPTDFGEETRAALRTRADTVEAEGMSAVAETVARNGMAPSFQDSHPHELEEYIALLAANDPAGYAAQCRVVAELDITDDLGRISAPVLLAVGDRDAVSPPAANERNAARIPSARYVQVEDCGHILPWERPEDLREAARPFLAEHLLSPAG